METIDLVNAAIAGDQGAFKAAFDSAMAARVTDALEVKKVELQLQVDTQVDYLSI